MRPQRTSVIHRAVGFLTSVLNTHVPLAAVFFILLSFTPDRVSAQIADGDLIFKFSVHGIGDRTEAKPVQKALLEHEFVTSCAYIPECRCFKLASSVSLDYAALNALLHEDQHELDGAVEVSNGNMLWPPQPDER